MNGCSPRFALAVTHGEPARVTVSWEALTQSIVDALAEAFRVRDVNLTLAVADHSGDLAVVEAAASAEEAKLAQLTREQGNLLDAIQQHGLGSMLEQIQSRHKRLEAEISESRSRLAAARMAVAQEEMAIANRRSARSVSEVLDFVAALRDPHSMAAREFLRRTVDSLEFTVTRSAAGGRDVTWSGQLLLSAGEHSFAVSFRGAEHVGPEAKARVNSGMLKTGEPLGDDWVSSRFTGRPRIKIGVAEAASELGLASGDRWVAHVGDPAIMRAYLSFLSSHTDAPSRRAVLGELAAQHGDAKTLMSNLQAVADRRRGTRVRWSRPRPSVETNSLIEVALHGSSDVDPRPLLTKPVHKAVYPLWSTRDGRYTVSPCQWCHGAVLARMTIDEPFGYVCLNSACRRDSAGVIWPADGFDRYVAFPDRWIAAGVNLVDAIPESVPTRGRRGWAPRKKRLSALTPNAVEAILRDYRERLPVRAIVKKHNLKDAHDVYWLLKEAKEPLLRFPDRHPR